MPARLRFSARAVPQPAHYGRSPCTPKHNVHISPLCSTDCGAPGRRVTIMCASAEHKTAVMC